MARPWLSPRRATVFALVFVALLGALAAVVLSRPSRSTARRALLESILQDDDHLLYSATPTVVRTLDTLRHLGVDRLRVTILWSALAPDPTAAHPPAGFQARDPAAYRAAAWFPYDRLLTLARGRGIDVAFNVTAPGPLWAMGQGAPSAKIATHLRPDPTAFGDFVAAVGRRYDGTWALRGASGAGLVLPRVSFWTIWNEPNQPGWLYPQWQQIGGHELMASPVLYRHLAVAAFAALGQTGHTSSADTVLIGELAPEGSEIARAGSAIPPLPFLRALYCLDASLQPLRGAAAGLLDCPTGGAPGAFRQSNPALFALTGFAHHPYSFFLAPTAHMTDPNFAPLADLRRLEDTLDGSLAAYGVHRRLPIYLTEYGYETNPPNPFRGVSLGLQSRYLNQAQHMASLDPRVRAMAQFLLVDAGPDTAYPPGSERYWSTFQTGLQFADGRPKPSLAAYALPLDVAQPTVAPGQPVTLWGMLRPAPNRTTQSALVQWRSVSGQYRTLRTVTTTDPAGILEAAVPVPGSGAVRLVWRAPGLGTLRSRSVGVTVR